MFSFLSKYKYSWIFIIIAAIILLYIVMIFLSYTYQEDLRVEGCYMPIPKIPVNRSKIEEDQGRYLQDSIFELTNRERERFALQHLNNNERLGEIAYLHSRDMIDRHFFDHVNPDGHNIEWRLKTYYPEFYGASGENIYQKSGLSIIQAGKQELREIAFQIVDGWMNSPGHRANILKPEFYHLGVGISISENDILATQVFGAPQVIFMKPLARELPPEQTCRVVVMLGRELAAQDKLIGLLGWPDPNMQFPIAGTNRYWIGAEQLVLHRWKDQLAIDFKAGNMAGEYVLKLGYDGKFYNVASFYVR